MKSLRGQLVFFWLLLFGMSAALAIVMVGLYRSSAGAQLAAGTHATEQSCRAIATRYAKSIAAPAPARPQLDLLQVLLQLVLVEMPHVEGGVWHAGSLVAYAYPTYEGSGTKRDIPVAEQPMLLALAARAARAGTLQTDVVRGSRETLIATACPLASAPQDLSAWTMTRAHVGTLEAQGSLRTGLGVLAAAVLFSGLWLGLILRRGLRHVERIEAQLAQAGGDAVPQLQATGVRELDRIVDGFNHYRDRFESARADLRAAAQQRNRDQRLAALGRMTGSIAHEIRNPVAAMRLKAENALAAAPGQQPAALRTIVGQIDRLDSLVQSLIALVQPLTLAPVAVALPDWLAERVAAFAPQAATRGVVVALVPGAPASAVFDPLHLARAVDNLLDNAVQHAPRGGQVLLAARQTGPDRLVLQVDDDGPGVPASLEPQLFEPFATGRAGGTGLGLALAREVALAHGGELRHVALSPGTRFELELPWRTC